MDDSPFVGVIFPLWWISTFYSQLSYFFEYISKHTAFDSHPPPDILFRTVPNRAYTPPWSWLNLNFLSTVSAGWLTRWVILCSTASRWIKTFSFRLLAQLIRIRSQQHDLFPILSTDVWEVASFNPQLWDTRYWRLFLSLVDLLFLLDKLSTYSLCPLATLLSHDFGILEFLPMKLYVLFEHQSAFLITYPYSTTTSIYYRRITHGFVFQGISSSPIGLMLVKMSLERFCMYQIEQHHSQKNSHQKNSLLPSEEVPSREFLCKPNQK